MTTTSSIDLMNFTLYSSVNALNAANKKAQQYFSSSLGAIAVSSLLVNFTELATFRHKLLY